MSHLLEKYNVSVPRYTSYPPANYFEPMDSERYAEAIRLSNHQGNPNISFYLHIPFCKHLCHYCGCNSYLLPRTGDTPKQYIAALHREIDLVGTLLDKDRKISQIHYGGGSPTAMPPAVLQELNDHILSLFPRIDDCEIAIECHPGYLNMGDWEQLLASHFNRFSIGVQDFDTHVLDIVNRRPALEDLRDVVAMLHEHGASINLDFLFGLPHQTADSFARTIAQAITIRPDRLVTFSYGHVPWVFKRQQTLERHGLPSSEVKREMYDQAARLLQAAGYKQIGLDHFVLPTDELYQALQDGMLYRNFQGYCTRRTTGQVYALGVTGISQLDSSYAQNTKDINAYIAQTAIAQLPTAKGYVLNEAQQICKAVIEHLMCNYQLSWSKMASVLNISPETLRQTIHYDVATLQEMRDDGIILLSEDNITMTEKGHPFVRNVAAALDPLMQTTTKKFSKPI